MKIISEEALVGYPDGIIKGITYGLNSFSGIPLMRNGVSADSLFYSSDTALPWLFSGHFCYDVTLTNNNIKR